MTELPDWIFGSLLADLGEFLGEPGLTLERCATMAAGASTDAERAIRGGRSQDEWWGEQTAYLYALARHHVANEERWRELYAQFPPSGLRHRALDFGCGIGTHTLAFSAMGWFAHGVDLSEAAIGYAQHRTVAHGSSAQFAVGNQPPIPGEFDLVCMHDVVGHLVRPRGTMCQVFDALNQGGVLYLTYNNARQSSESALHRNAEIDFPAMLSGFGLQRESAFVWRKPA